MPEPSPLRLKLAPFPERVAQYPKKPPNSWTNEGERRPMAWNASGQALVPECWLPTPLREISTVSVAPDGTVAIGGPDGLAALEHGRWRCYAGQRWLPSNDVRRVLCREAGAMFAETSAGGSLILTQTRTLADKAVQYEAQIEERHNRGGYVTVCFLDDPHVFTGGHQHEVSDNDGLWTAMYLAAEAFRFAATGEVEARERAARSLRALLELERVTGIPGFPARALAQEGEPQAVLSSGEWHEAADGRRVWKGDTSSDEIVGHFFGLSVYYELVADEPERAAIRETIRRITDHILEHGYLLIDADGRHTRWGVWSPELLSTPQWAGDRGLNSLEILSHLRVAAQIVGDPKYEAAARELVETHGYALNTVQQKNTRPGHVNHSDDELAFLSYYPLLRYETDPHRRALYLASLERSWQIERPECCPLWNVIYGALTGRPCDLDAAAESLQEIPLDLRHWTVRNSQRPDVEIDSEAGRFGEAQSRRVLPAGERPLMKWNGNPYRLDGGDGGRTEEDGTFFLLPYWMARYHGLFEEV